MSHVPAACVVSCTYCLKWVGGREEGPGVADNPLYEQTKIMLHLL